MGPKIVYSTYPSQDAARAAGRAVVEARLAACANAWPGVAACYRWEGRIEESQESLLWLKTSGERVEALVESLRASHPYELPAIVVLDVVGGLPDYLAWIEKETT